MNLRPHHILCIKHYEGKGYSEAFNKKMSEVISALGSGESFKLVCGADDLCAVCPNANNGVCRSSEKVNRYDDAVIDILSVSYGSQYGKEEISGLAADKIYGTGRFELICPDCEWAYICHRK